MKQIINAVKVGNVISLSINGKLHKKACGSSKEANELFTVVLEARKNPTDENIKKIRMFLNEKTRIAMLAGLEADSETGEIYLAGFNTPIPMTLVDVIKEYHENGYPLDAIINFWKLLMINPDVRVRTSLFDFITTHDFVLTDKGYMVVYKAVYDKNSKEDNQDNGIDTSFSEFISNRYLHVKKTWKESPKNYVVYKKVNKESGDEYVYNITKVQTAEKWDEESKNIEILGNLAELFDAIFNSESQEEEKKEVVPVFTDMHTRSMTIELGKPVKQERRECDSDPAKDCSNGLHVGATKYVENFGKCGAKVLVCLVNPANVIAVPDYDHSKMRVCEYFPYAIATYTNNKIDIIEQSYFEDDYCEYEIEELQMQIEKIQADELPIGTAQNAQEEGRSMNELLKIVESRLLDLE
jgi:hypothetical protein